MAETQYVHISIVQGEKTIDVTLEQSSEWPGYRTPHILALLEQAVEKVKQTIREAEAYTANNKEVTS
jgi:hypothetical protein